MPYLKWGTLKRPGPGFWAWCLWLDRGRKGARPNVTWVVPPWAWVRYAIHRGTHKPPPVQAPPSPFAGIGMLTAQDPRAALQLRGLIDWVALKADGGDKADPAVVNELRAARLGVLVWEAENRLGQVAVDTYDAEGWIAQDEGPGNRSAALAVAPHVRVPKAMVSNLWAPDWPAGFACLGEAYKNVNPNATPMNMAFRAQQVGAGEFSPTFAHYDGASEQPPPGPGRKVSLAEYLANWPNKRNWNGYLAEYFVQSDEDVAELRRL